MFLKQVAQDIINKQSELQRFCLVFPNKRTDVYFKKYFAQIIGKSSWSPETYTIENIIKKQTRLKNPDKLFLLFELYEIFKNYFYKKDTNFFKDFTFDKFFPTGEIILRDFNEIDNYLVNVKDLYQNIESFEKIDFNLSYFTEEQKAALKEFWQNFSIEKASDEKDRFIELWNALPEIYKIFTTSLLSKKLAYNGLRNRYLAKKITANEADFNLYDTYIFIGFNALNKTEKKLFGHLHKIGKAKFYWDYDNYYIADNKQEAGLYLRENLKVFPDEFKEKHLNLLSSDKKVEIIGVPLEVGQAKTIPTIFKNLKIDFANEKELEKTVIIIPDEEMLFPILHSIPPEIKSVNVTLGFPLKDTTLYALLKNWLQLQNSYQIKKKYYYKDVLGIISHPSISDKLGELSKKISQHIESVNMVNVMPSYLLAYKNDLLDLLFTPLSKDANVDILTSMLNLLFTIFNKSLKEEDQDSLQTIDNEYIYQVYLQIKRLKEIIENTTNVDFNTNLIIKLLNQVINSIRIPFTGKTIDGLQVTTLMETRNLDFENVIILSMNEGIIPEKSQSSSFISQTMRVAFDLPVAKFQDSLFAYFFYGVIQRAKNITLLYNNTSGSSNSNGELSRFVQQLIFETNLNIEHKQFKQELIPVKNKRIFIDKNENILSSLNSYFIKNKDSTKQFSASGINTFIDCSLKFYFRYIAQIKQPEMVEEEISPLTFGNILHNTIEKLYSDFLENKKSYFLDSKDFAKIKKLVPKYVSQAFKEEYNLQENEQFQFTGTNIIIREAIVQNIENILKIDKKYAPFKIIDLEAKYGYTAEIKVDTSENETKKIGLRGIFDRVDEKDGIRRVIDYKTGSVKKRFTTLESLFMSDNASRNRTVFQALFYGLIMKQKFGNADFKPGIYDIRGMVKKDFSADLIFGKLNIEPDNFAEIINEFEFLLSEKFSELFDIEIPFVQTKNARNCEYCEYRGICGR